MAFVKYAFSITIFAGYVWTVGQTGGKKSPFSCALSASLDSFCIHVASSLYTLLKVPF